MSRGKVLIAAAVHPVLPAGLEKAGFTIVEGQDWSREQLLGSVHDFIGIITANRLPIDAEIIYAGSCLKWIGRTGSGLEIIDTAAAKLRGIAVYNSPEGNCNAVGEHTVGLLLSVLHRISYAAAEVREGIWRREENRGHELRGRTVGIIGLGHTGSAFAGMLQGFGVRVLYYDKYRDAAPLPGTERCPDLSAIAEHCSVVSFHLPLNAETAGYFDEGFLARMKQPFILLNTSRGEIVRSETLAAGLAAGSIEGFGGDVWPGEPLANMSQESRKILQEITLLPNVCVTPHIAGYTYEAYFQMSNIILKKILGE